MIRKIKMLFVLISAIFIGGVFTGAYFSDNVSTTNNIFTAGTWAVTPSASPTPPPSPASVVLNEYMPNPSGNDDDPMPQGEWVELYNNGGTALDVDGWRIYDAAGAYVPIISGNIVGGSTVVPAGGYLVVYRNGYSFSLNNSGAETVYLYDGDIGSGTLVDSHSYSGSTEDKTWARVPDGGGWSDGHVKTPGGPNV